MDPTGFIVLKHLHVKNGLGTEIAPNPPNLTRTAHPAEEGDKIFIGLPGLNVYRITFDAIDF